LPTVAYLIYCSVLTLFLWDLNISCVLWLYYTDALTKTAWSLILFNNSNHCTTWSILRWILHLTFSIHERFILNTVTGYDRPLCILKVLVQTSAHSLDIFSGS
jgi:hypothetical protein